jgi:hypothetical protein
MHKGNEFRATPSRHSGRLFQARRLLAFLLGWLLIMPLATILIMYFFAICIPIGAVDSLWREHRVRRIYRSVKRLLHWNQASQMLSSGQGTLIIEVHLLERSGRVWWIESDLRTRHPDFPLAPARVLDPSFDIEERVRLLHNDAAEAWWNAHLPELIEGVFLVQMPLTFWWRRQGVLAIPNAVAVDDDWTYSFYKHRS